MAAASFEQSLTRLEELVRQLENGNLTLEEGLSTFEEGMTLAQHCQKQLDAAQARIETLMVKDAQAREQPL
ncbi:MAG: exodeoxyribonuclease VII small subunit [Magnetococcales bacterium]|nr:exodeoxyribonuclease VII small subunit [Magnetococcales bacterium]